MNISPDVENRADPDGLREIRSWASRSPDAARPGFRARGRSRARRVSSRLAFLLPLALLLFLSFAGYRFLQTGRGETGGRATILVASPAPVAAPAAGAAPAVAEALPDSPQVRKEPSRAAQAAAVLPERPAARAPRPQKATFRPQPVPRESRRTSEALAVVHREAFESEPAVLLAPPAAQYPDAARGTGARAQVVVGFTIDETGTVSDPRIESARVEGEAPESVFAEAALAAVRGARFEPARERGVPSPSWSTLTFTFEAGTH